MTTLLASVPSKIYFWKESRKTSLTMKGTLPSWKLRYNNNFPLLSSKEFRRIQWKAFQCPWNCSHATKICKVSLQTWLPTHFIALDSKLLIRNNKWYIIIGWIRIPVNSLYLKAVFLNLIRLYILILWFKI